jgi:hypothetical protein
MGIFCILAFDVWFVTSFFNKTKQALKDSISRVNFKAMLKPALLMTGIYMTALIALFRANFYYIDDLGRTIDGYIGMYPLSRYVSQILGMVIHADFNINDISPLPQMLAAAFIAAASVLLVYLLNNGKITISGLLASIALGLSPHFLQCLSYKFDAPYMALSVLASLVPFLFRENRRAFIASSVFSIWVMCMSYQASSGVYIMLTLALAFRDWSGGQKSGKEAGVFIATAAASYCAALVMFRIFLMYPSGGYIGSAMFSLPELLPGVLGNFKRYALLINDDFALLWKAVAALICVLFILTATKETARNKGIAALISAAALFAAFFLSFGAYLALEKPLYSPRGIYGFGIFIAIAAVSITGVKHKINTAAALAMSWCFFVFAFTYGNALYAQKQYSDFRHEILVNDLSRIFPKGASPDMLIQLEGDAGFAPPVRRIASHYPVITRLVPVLPKGPKDWFGTYNLLKYFNWGTFEMRNFRNIGHNDVNTGEAVEFVEGDFMTFDLPVVLDTSYHTIKTDGRRILVVLKAAR